MFGPRIDKITEALKEALDQFFRRRDLSDNPDKLREEIVKLKEQKAELEFQKGLEKREIAHLVKMKEEKIEIETEKQRLDLVKSFQEREMAMQKDYFEKVMATIEKGQDKMEDLYSKILERLPNVNMEIRKGGQ